MGLKQRRVVTLSEPAGEARQVRHVQPRTALAKPGVVGQEHDEVGQRIIRRKGRVFLGCDRASLRVAAGQAAQDRYR